MIRVNYEGKQYAYVASKSAWVSPSNEVVLSPKKLDDLREIAVSLGYTDVDLARPEYDMDQYVKMIEEFDKKDSLERESREEVPQEVSSKSSVQIKLKKTTGISLSKNKRGE